MKILVLTIVVVILLFSSSIFIDHYIENFTERLLEAVDTLETSIDHKEWETTAEQHDLLKKEWMEGHEKVKLFINHEDLDDIDLTVARLQGAIHMQSELNAYDQLESLRWYIHNVRERISFTLQNVL